VHKALDITNYSRKKQIGNRGGLPIARAKTPNLPAKEAGTPVLGYPYPTKKASCQVLP
jgi:hypothetical protein